jgi:hypothetical protein
MLAFATRVLRPMIQSRLRAKSRRLSGGHVWIGCIFTLIQSTILAASFSVREDPSGWNLVDPSGRPFFSRGVCVVTPGDRPEMFDPENPSYAAWRHYPDTATWARTTSERLTSWGFTTLGAWSDTTSLSGIDASQLLLTPVLHLGSTVGAPWWDMWDKGLLSRMDRVARDQILPLKNHPRVIGYYSDNELGWWNATLWKMTLEQSPRSGQRRRLIQLLRDTYHQDWNQLLADFEPENAENWRGLERGGMLYLRPGGQGFRVQRQFLSLLARRYYQLVHQLIRKYHPGALVLGDRYQSFYYPEVVEAATPWVDVISCNLNASWSDGSFLRCQLDTLNALSRKPVLVSEYYCAAEENRSGNRNNHGIFPTAPSQSIRSLGASNTLVRLARTPYVVGADWFQYFDQPRHGRSDGENYNFGLVDTQDRPYDELTRVFRAIDADSLRKAPAPDRPDASRGVPRAPADPFAEFTPKHALEGWDRELGYVPPSSKNPLADLYICWNPKAVYLGLYALDITEDAFYRDKRIPKSDRALWTIRISGSHAVHARIGAGREPIPSDPNLQMRNLSGVNLSVRNIAAIELPAARWGRDHFKAGDHIELDVTFSSHLKAYNIEWKGSFVLNDSRPNGQTY